MIQLAIIFLNKLFCSPRDLLARVVNQNSAPEDTPAEKVPFLPPL
jgi:hypothetical protein